MKHHPEISSRARSAFSPATMSGIAYAAALCAVCIILVGLGADVRPYLLVGAWLVIGAGYWLVRSNTQRGNSPRVDAS